MLIEIPEWWSRAACQHASPDLHFPNKGGSAREAKRICNGVPGVTAACPVRELCLDEALENADTFGRYGVRGGLTEQERLRLKRRLQPPPRQDRYTPHAKGDRGDHGRCRQGHAIAGDNATRGGHTSDGSVRWICGICRSESQRRYRAKIKRAVA